MARSAIRMRYTWPCSSKFANGFTISICCTFTSITIHFPCFPANPHHSSLRSTGLDLPEHQVVFATFPSIPVISISDAQRRPVPRTRWVRTFHHGLPEQLLTPQPVRSDEVARHVRADRPLYRHGRRDQGSAQAADQADKQRFCHAEFQTDDMAHKIPRCIEWITS